MKIAWLQDLNPMGATGGAQQNDRAMIIAGFKRGHDIEIVGPGDSPDVLEWADKVVVSNAVGFPIGLFQACPKPYIFFLHDFWPLCRVRLYYPMLTKCKTCFRKPTWIPVMERASLIIWLSRLHRHAWLYACPELRGVPYALVPSAIDPSEFHDLGLPRAGVVAVNAGQAYKGRNQVITWAGAHPGSKLTMVGDCPNPGEFPPNVGFMGNVHPRSINTAYNKFETFLHLPETVMPFDRTVVEALLAGCKIVGNKNIGALSWEEMQSNKEDSSGLLRDSAIRRWLLKAPGQFWNKVEQAT